MLGRYVRPDQHNCHGKIFSCLYYLTVNECFAAHLTYYNYLDEFQYNISTVMAISSETPLDRPYCVQDLGSWIHTAAL